jgi:hypothetical protein
VPCERYLIRSPKGPFSLSFMPKGSNYTLKYASSGIIFALIKVRE